jgi:hypothetical protein
VPDGRGDQLNLAQAHLAPIWLAFVEESDENGASMDGLICGVRQLVDSLRVPMHKDERVIVGVGAAPRRSRPMKDPHKQGCPYESTLLAK